MRLARWRSPRRRGASCSETLVHELAATPSSAHGARWQTWNLSRLYLRRSPLGRRFTMVDAASKATPSPLRAPRRAPDEKCLLTVDVDEKSCTCPCVPDVLCWEL